MELTKIRIRNYRLITDAVIEIDRDLTLIVGRNNTAKTSCIEMIENIINGKRLSYDDYPLSKRDEFHDLVLKFIKRKITYEELVDKLQLPSIEFWVDYTLDDPNANLGALSPFIIDIDVDTTDVRIRVEYKLKVDEKFLREEFEPLFYVEQDFKPENIEIRNRYAELSTKMFEPVIYAINPKHEDDKQVKNLNELSELFPIYTIHAERVLGEDGNQNDSSLSELISGFFNMDEDDLDPQIANEIKKLKEIVEDANKHVQQQSDELLSQVVNNAVGFGYPNTEEMQLGVTTKLEIDDQIKNHTRLSYISGNYTESLPSTYNGLGYKNLIKMEFLLVTFAKEIEKKGNSCIPLLFIEEPECHMHPQMQKAFANYLESFVQNICKISIQVVLTSHSAHIANTIDFSKIRYAQKTVDGVIYKNLNCFASENKDNVEFIRKYLELTRCDLFFADKAILIEGATERILLPDVIQKCDREGLFSTIKYGLASQYFSLIEVGGAYAHLFIPFLNFLGIPSLILTDLDSVDSSRNNKSVPVSKGNTTSNATIKYWYRLVNGISLDDKNRVSLTDIINLSAEEKTIGKCHIEFQTEENGLCGHSLEEAIRNVNRTHYNLGENPTEDDIEFKDKCKTNFALNLICENAEYIIPAYIKNGLIWLNEEKVLE